MTTTTQSLQRVETAGVKLHAIRDFLDNASGKAAGISEEHFTSENGANYMQG